MCAGKGITGTDQRYEEDVAMKNRVVIAFSQEELRVLHEIVRHSDGERAMEYLARLEKRGDLFLEPK